MDTFLKGLEGLTVVETAELEGEGFAILFDDGIILIVTDNEHHTWTGGGAWNETWDLLTS